MKSFVAIWLVSILENWHFALGIALQNTFYIALKSKFSEYLPLSNMLQNTFQDKTDIVVYMQQQWSVHWHHSSAFSFWNFGWSKASVIWNSSVVSLHVENWGINPFRFQSKLKYPSSQLPHHCSLHCSHCGFSHTQTWQRNIPLYFSCPQQCCLLNLLTGTPSYCQLINHMQMLVHIKIEALEANTFNGLNLQSKAVVCRPNRHKSQTFLSACTAIVISYPAKCWCY